MALHHDELQQLLTYVAADGEPVHPAMQSGLSVTMIQTAFASIGLNPPDDVVQLYTWADGIGIDEQIIFFDDHAFLTLDAAIATYHEYLKWSSDDVVDARQWFPFASYNGSFLLIYCGSTGISELQHPILRLYEGATLSFTDLGTMIRTLLVWHRTKTYHQEYPTNGPKMQQWMALNPGLPRVL